MALVYGVDPYDEDSSRECIHEQHKLSNEVNHLHVESYMDMLRMARPHHAFQEGGQATLGSAPSVIHISSRCLPDVCNIMLLRNGANKFAIPTGRDKRVASARARDNQPITPSPVDGVVTAGQSTAGVGHSRRLFQTVSSLVGARHNVFSAFHWLQVTADHRPAGHPSIMIRRGKACPPGWRDSKSSGVGQPSR